MCMFAKEPECSSFNKTGRIAQGNLVPVTEVQAFTPQPTVAWIIWNSTCMNAEGVEMLSNLKIGLQEDWEPAHLRTEQQSIQRLESFSVYSGRSRLQCLINTGKKLPKVNIDASYGSMSYLDFLAIWCGIPSLCLQEGMSLF